MSPKSLTKGWRKTILFTILNMFKSDSIFYNKVNTIYVKIEVHKGIMGEMNLLTATRIQKKKSLKLQA